MEEKIKSEKKKLRNSRKNVQATITLKFNIFNGIVSVVLLEDVKAKFLLAGRLSLAISSGLHTHF